MSSEIRNNEAGGVRYASLRMCPAGVVVNERVRVSTADFIAAVEAECDGIFIPRAELPEVIVDREWIEVDGQTFAATIQQGMNPDGIRAAYLRNLAAFEYLKAHPPVDEEQVEALATSFAEVAESDGGCKDGWNATIIARRLIAAGWSK